jgi:hypothetical protein
MTTLSFVTPARNEARFIAPTIDSLRRPAPALQLAALGAGMGAWLALAAPEGPLLRSSLAMSGHTGAAASLVNALVLFRFAGRAWGFLRFLRGERRAASPRGTRQER